MRSAGFKWIASDDPVAGIQLYDLTTDPDEKQPIDDPAMLELGREIEASYRSVKSTAQQGAAEETKPGAPKKPEIDDATVDKLKALGYMD
jgi:hypothetical protein